MRRGYFYSVGSIWLQRRIIKCLRIHRIRPPPSVYTLYPTRRLWRIARALYALDFDPHFQIASTAPETEVTKFANDNIVPFDSDWTRLLVNQEQRG